MKKKKREWASCTLWNSSGGLQGRRSAAQESVDSLVFAVCLLFSQFPSPVGAFIYAFQSLTNEVSLIPTFSLAAEKPKPKLVKYIQETLVFLNARKHTNNTYQGHKIYLYAHGEALSSNGCSLFSVIPCTPCGSLIGNILFYFIFFLTISVNNGLESRLYFSLSGKMEEASV